MDEGKWLREDGKWKMESELREENENKKSRITSYMPILHKGNQIFIYRQESCNIIHLTYPILHKGNHFIHRKQSCDIIHLTYPILHKGNQILSIESSLATSSILNTPSYIKVIRFHLSMAVLQHHPSHIPIFHKKGSSSIRQSPWIN